MAANQSIKINVIDEDEDTSSAPVSASDDKETVPITKNTKPKKVVRAKKIVRKTKVKKTAKAKKISAKSSLKLKIDEELDSEPMAKIKITTPAPVEASSVSAKRVDDIVKPAAASAITSTPATATGDIQAAGGVVKETVASLLKEEAAKTKATEETEAIKAAGFKHSIKTYKKIAYSFVVLTIILLSVAAYFTLVKVNIVLIPNQERVSNNLIFDVMDKDKNASIPESAVSGVVKAIEISDAKNYPSTGKQVIGEELTGQVKIINNYNKNQPLVATTRLLTSDGKLFRIKDTVNVPAGGSVTVGVYADQPSKDMVVGPTKFTIPGLWAGLQSQIYAESDQEIKYQEKAKKYITQEDIDNAIRDMKQQLLAKAKTEINEQYKDYDQIIYKIDENSVKSEVDSSVSEEKDEFGVSMQAGVVVVAFDEDKSAKLAEQKFISTLSASKELINFDKANIAYALNSFDEPQGSANITATFEGKISLRADSKIVEVDKILGLNSQQLNTYLSGLADIAGFEVRYYPSFIKYVPRLADRITVEIKK